MISENHYLRLKSVFTKTIQDGAKLEMGGEFNEEQRYVSPTLLSNVPLTSIISTPILIPFNLEEFHFICEV